ncbi:MAG: sigma-54-dependent Fis family transcriptional regulator, partial [Gammaproteobacteria bacterium]|nr:sigma-54-dependent Fis family transcriptional regulator [Gammaproteobacteria bacterium]
GAIKSAAGKFELAQGGTLLLDEVTEMNLELQAKLLRLLQEREVERLGSQRTIKLDVRVLATSNRDLRQAVSDGRFREDLYYRLNVFPLHIPPLAERPGDIRPLAESLLAHYKLRYGDQAVRLGEAAIRLLQRYSWPGNVRELDSVIQRALILAQGSEIGVEDIYFDAEAIADATGLATGVAEGVAEGVDRSAQPQPPKISSDAAKPRETPARLDADLQRQEFQIIANALQQGSRQEVADQLGISPRTLRYKLAKLRSAGYAIS